MIGTIILREKKMAIAKIWAFFLGGLNVFIYIFAWIANLDSIKSTILFVVALIMSGYRFYRWAINSQQNKKLKDLSIRQREIEVQEKEIEILERRQRATRR